MRHTKLTNFANEYEFFSEHPRIPLMSEKALEQSAKAFVWHAGMFSQLAFRCCSFVAILLIPNDYLAVS